MSQTFNKIKYYLKKFALFCGLFLVLFSALVYVINLNIKPVPKTALTVTPTADASANNDQQLKQRLGSSNISVAGFEQWAKVNNLTGANIYDADPDGDGLPNYLEYIYGTDPNKADTDGDGFSDKQEIDNGYDPVAAQGDPKIVVSLRIDKLGVAAPMVWSTSENEKDMLTDLEKGVSHYAQTTSPGQNGNMIISGHSSNYIWAKGDYNHIFENLNNLENGDVISIDTFQKNGKIITYHYVINDKFITAPDDERIFAETTTPTLTLSTCWPIGTALKRTIIKAELIK